MRSTFNGLAFSACCLLAMSACGDPAPGEGANNPNQKETMPEVVPASEAIASPDIPSIDLYSMAEAQYEKVIPEGSRCTFSYSAAGRPVLAAAVGADNARGAVMIHGRLVELAAQANTFDRLAEGGTFTSGTLSVQVIPEPEGETHRERGKIRREADALLVIDQGLQVGYTGWYTCNDEPEA